jgi:SSS family solute:Na+ symporter
MFEKLAQSVPEMLKTPGLDAAGNVWTWGGFSSAVAISVFGFSVWPHYFMKIYTARDIKTLKKTVVFYPTFQIFLVPIMLIGFAGIQAFPGVEPADAILPTIVTSMALPALLIGFFCAGALAASMSTGDAIVHAAASICVKDFAQSFLQIKMSARGETRLIRILVFVIGAIAYVFAVNSRWSLVDLLLLSYEAMAQIFPAVIAAVFWRRSTPAGVLSGLVAGCVVSLIWLVFPSLQWQQIHPGIFGLIANVFCLIVVSKATRPMDTAYVDTFMKD